MASQLSFNIMFEKLLSSLRSSNKIVEISSHFGPNKDIESMFKFVWNMDEVHSYIQINLPQMQLMKDNKRSEDFRTMGNKFYQKKQLLKALEFYNKSITHSPQYNHSNHNSDNNSNNFSPEVLELSESKNLAIAYANRSAVLYELQKYEECLLDTKRSAKYGYPSLIRVKLFEREAKCYLAQKQTEKAKLVLKDGLIYAKNLELNKESYIKICHNLEGLLSRCDTEDFVEENSLSSNYQMLQYTCTQDKPVLPKSNYEIPSLSNAVSLCYAPDRGRFLVADRDISPGEILINETCFSFITLPSSLDSHCSFCLKKIFNPVPCKFCTSVIFCSEECLSKASNQFHNTECCILSSVFALDLGMNAMLALRLIVQTPLRDLKTLICKYLETNSADSSRFGFNENSVYSSDDYRTIYFLVTNKNQRSVSDLFKRSVMAACIVKLLLRTNYFGCSFQNLNDITTDVIEDICFVGVVLFIHLMNLPCNAHSITELMVQTNKYQESHIEEIGAGAFGVLSLTNHSCNPSLARSCYGKTIVAKAIKFIPKGSEIFDSYGEHFAIRNKKERQKYLSQQYYFQCSCEACSQNWCLYNDLSDNICINCIQCLNSLTIQGNNCKNCKKFTKDIEVVGEKDFSNMEELIQHIQESVKLYHSSYDSILKGNLIQENLENVLNVICCLSKFVHLPNKILFEAQETIKHCFDRQGSHYNI